jgi:hypothetical protein
VLVTAIAAALLVAAHPTVSISAELLNILVYLILGSGSAAAITYLHRHRRP